MYHNGNLLITEYPFNGKTSYYIEGDSVAEIFKNYINFHIQRLKPVKRFQYNRFLNNSKF